MTWLNEYAIEPIALSNWRDFRYVFEKLGFYEARLGLRLPPDWEQRVLGACADDVDRKRIEESLKRYSQERLLAPPLLGGARTGSWLATVSAVHQRRRLAGVIAASIETDPSADPPIASVHDAGEEFFRVERAFRVPCSGKAMAEAGRVLFRLSPRVFVIDPYFQPLGPQWRESLLELGRVARQEGCEYLDVVSSDERLPKEPTEMVETFFVRCLGERHVKPLVTLRFLKSPTNGDDQHARYLLSDAGALYYDRGFRAVGADVRNDVSVVAKGLHQELVDEFLGTRQKGQTVFEAQWPKKPPRLNLNHRR